MSLSFVPTVLRIAKQSTVVNLHLPMLESGIIAQLLKHVPIVSTYHIDLWLSPSLLNSIQILGVNYSARNALKKSSHIVVNSRDQGEFSIMWSVIKKKAMVCNSCPLLRPKRRKPSIPRWNWLSHRLRTAELFQIKELSI